MKLLFIWNKFVYLFWYEKEKKMEINANSNFHMKYATSRKNYEKIMRTLGSFQYEKILIMGTLKKKNIIY